MASPQLSQKPNSPASMRGERGGQPLALGLAPGMGGLGHRLVLQGVLPAEPTHRLLVERDRGLTGLAEAVFAFKVAQPGLNQCAIMFL